MYINKHGRRCVRGGKEGKGENREQNRGKEIDGSSETLSNRYGAPRLIRTQKSSSNGQSLSKPINNHISY